MPKKSRRGFQEKCPKKKLDGKVFEGNFKKEICSEDYNSHFIVEFSYDPFTIHIKIKHLVDGVNFYTDEKYDYSELHSFYVTYFDALKFSECLNKEDLKDIKHLCLYYKK